MISKGSEKAREMIKKAHRADMDIILTANILMHVVHQLKINSMEQLFAVSEDARIPRVINFASIAAQRLPNSLLTIFSG